MSLSLFLQPFQDGEGKIKLNKAAENFAAEQTQQGNALSFNQALVQLSFNVDSNEIATNPLTSVWGGTSDRITNSYGKNNGLGFTTLTSNEDHYYTRYENNSPFSYGWRA